VLTEKKYKLVNRLKIELYKSRSNDDQIDREINMLKGMMQQQLQHVPEVKRAALI